MISVASVMCIIRSTCWKRIECTAHFFFSLAHLCAHIHTSIVCHWNVDTATIKCIINSHLLEIFSKSHNFYHLFALSYSNKCATRCVNVCAIQIAAKPFYGFYFIYTKRLLCCASLFPFLQTKFHVWEISELAAAQRLSQ